MKAIEWAEAHVERASRGGGFLGYEKVGPALFHTGLVLVLFNPEAMDHRVHLLAQVMQHFGRLLEVSERLVLVVDGGVDQLGLL